MRTLHFYMDDSGTRHPDLKEKGNGNQPNWFGLGGVIVDEADEEKLKETIQAFKKKMANHHAAALMQYSSTQRRILMVKRQHREHETIP